MNASLTSEFSRHPCEPRLGSNYMYTCDGEDVEMDKGVNECRQKKDLF